MAGLAGAAGLATYALSTSAAFGLTKRLDPSLATLERNRYIAGGAFTAAGLLIALFANESIGAGVAAGGLAALAGTQLSFAIDPVFQLGAAPAAAATGGTPAPAATPAATTKGLGAVFGGGRQRLGMGAIFSSGGRQQLGAVFAGPNTQLLSGIEDRDDSYFGG